MKNLIISLVFVHNYECVLKPRNYERNCKDKKGKNCTIVKGRKLDHITHGNGTARKSQ